MTPIHNIIGRFIKSLQEKNNNYATKAADSMRKEPSYARLHQVASAIPKYHSLLSTMHETDDELVQTLHTCQYDINSDNKRTFRHKIKQVQRAS